MSHSWKMQVLLVFSVFAAFCVLWLSQNWPAVSNRRMEIDDVNSPLTSSHAATCGGNKARETGRSGQPRRRGRPSLMTEARALIPKGVNLRRPRYANAGGQPSRDGEASTCREEADKSTCGTGRGRGGRRVFQELLVKLGDPLERRPVRQVPPGINNRTGMLGWESDGSVVAMKWGNAHGAKGPWYT